MKYNLKVIQGVTPISSSDAIQPPIPPVPSGTTPGFPTETVTDTATGQVIASVTTTNPDSSQKVYNLPISVVVQGPKGDKGDPYVLTPALFTNVGSRAFSLQVQPPIALSTSIEHNGVVYRLLSNDYTLSGHTLTLNNLAIAPKVGDTFLFIS